MLHLHIEKTSQKSFSNSNEKNSKQFLNLNSCFLTFLTVEVLNEYYITVQTVFCRMVKGGKIINAFYDNDV